MPQQNPIQSRIPFGDEEITYLFGVESNAAKYTPPSDTDTCPVCETPVGSLHVHPCEHEQCPECGNSLIDCDHTDTLIE